MHCGRSQPIQQLRSQLLELKNGLGTRQEREIAEEAVKAILQPAVGILEGQNPETISESMEALRDSPWVKEYVRVIKLPWFELTLAAKNSEIDLTTWKRAKYKDLVRQKVKGKTNGKIEAANQTNARQVIVFQFI